MIQQLDLLKKYQQIENEIYDLSQRLEALPLQREALEQERLKFSLELETERESVKTLQATYRQDEMEAKQIQAMVSKSDAKLSSVKTNKEYQATLKEIEDLHAKASAVEDAMLEALEKIDQVEVSVSENEKDFKQLSHRIEQDKTAIDIETRSLETALSHCEAEERKLTSKIDTSVWERFQFVKSLQNDRICVVSVNDSICNGCHLNIPPQMYNELQRRDKLMLCPHCQRIIYWEPK